MKLILKYYKVDCRREKGMIKYYKIQKEADDLDRNVSINTDLNGRKVVMINDIRFKGKRKIDWTDVENYLKKYIGEIYEIEDTQDKIYIGKDLPDEFSGSEDTSRFALPVYGENGEVERYNVFCVEILIRHADDKRKYLYDLVNIKKETSTPLEQ